MNLKIKYLRFLVKIKKFFGKRDNFSEKEEIIYSTAMKLVHKPNTTVNRYNDKLDVEKIYIKSENGQYAMVIAYKEVKFTNHEFFYELEISEELSNKIIRTIKKKLNNDRMRMEEETFTNKLKIMTDALNRIEEI